MDWFLDGHDPAAVSALRHEVADYLRRHAVDGGDLDDAQLVVSELLGNAVRHAAGPVWVTLSWGGESPTLTVQDLGPGFDPGLLENAGARPIDPLQESGRGLFLISHLAPAFEAVARETAGMKVSVTLPVDRKPELSHNRPRRSTTALPNLEEARPEGGFGRESFLRALVVQLAQTLEFDHGPDAAESAVTQVGTDVGGRMEEEFRLAEQVTGRMTPQQLADCYVRLKHAIDGDFFVIEASEKRVVLGNAQQRRTGDRPARGAHRRRRSWLPGRRTAAGGRGPRRDLLRAPLPEAGHLTPACPALRLRRADQQQPAGPIRRWPAGPAPRPARTARR